MKDEMERHQVVYGILKIQIQFGVFRFGDILPAMENAAADFLVSIDTIRMAYQQLQREGFVSISTNTGTMVVKDYEKSEIEQNIQTFFAQRKSAMLDLSKSLRPLLGHAQWVGFRNMKQNAYTVFEHTVQAYAALKNNLLFRFVWHVFMFFDAPLFSLPDKHSLASVLDIYFEGLLKHCRKQEWDSLRELIYTTQDDLSLLLCQFYKEKITVSPPEQEISFKWSSYKKASQICYSLAMDLLISISQDKYPANSLLPSLSKLSKERQVSVSTVRRALSLLNGIGATKSFKRIGTKVLPLHETARNCDFTNPVVRKRLLDMAQSLQFLTLSCRAVAEETIPALDEGKQQTCRERLSALKDRGQYELITYTALDLLKCFAPYQTIRTVYTELLQMLFWGYALRVMWKNDDDRISYYLSCFKEFDCSLADANAVRFSRRLEELMLREFDFTIRNMSLLGIHEAEELLLPEI